MNDKSTRSIHKSFELVRAAQLSPRITTMAEYCLATALASFAGTKGCFPSLPKLLKRARIKDSRAYTRAINSLIAKGIVTVDPVMRGKQRLRTNYYLDFSSGVGEETRGRGVGNAQTVGEETRGRGVGNARKGGVGNSPQTNEFEQIKEQTKKQNREAPIPAPARPAREENGSDEAESSKYDWSGVIKSRVFERLYKGETRDKQKYDDEDEVELGFYQALSDSTLADKAQAKEKEGKTTEQVTEYLVGTLTDMTANAIKCARVCASR